MPGWLWAIIGFIIGAAVFFFVGYKRKVKNSEGQIYEAEEEAKRIINESIKIAESKKREEIGRAHV